MFSENSATLVGYDQAQSLFTEYTRNINPKAVKIIINFTPAELLSCFLNFNRSFLKIIHLFINFSSFKLFYHLTVLIKTATEFREARSGTKKVLTLTNLLSDTI